MLHIETAALCVEQNGISEEKVSETVMRRVVGSGPSGLFGLSCSFGSTNQRDKTDHAPDRLFPMLTKTDSKAFGL
jgi:hypothetical protein